MKKFMTVLLVIAVMFTFSFGSAFAVTSEEANLVKAASAYAQSTTAATIEQAYKAVLGATTNNVKYISAEAWDAAVAAIAKDINEDIQLAADGYLAGTVPAVAYPEDMNYVAAQLFPTLYKNYTTWAGELNDVTNEYAIMAAKEQFRMDLAEAMGVYDEVDLAGLYSTTVAAGETKSNYTKAEEAIANAKAQLNKYFFNTDNEVINVSPTVAGISNDVAVVKGWITNGFAGNVSLGVKAFVGIKAKYYTDTTVVEYYYVDGIETIEAEAADDAAKAATVAAVKAQIAANLANYAKDAAYDADFAKTYAEVYNYLAEEKTAETAVKVAAHADVAVLKVAKADREAALEAAIKAIESLEGSAAKYAAEKDATGAAVRDAEAIAKLVKKAKVSEYAAAALGVANDYSAATALADIAAMNVDAAAAKLAFDKEAKKADLADDLEALEDSYYELEYAAVKAAYETAYAEIDACEKEADFAKAVTKMNTAVSKIKDKAAVDALFSGTKMAAELNAKTALVKAYLDYANKPVEGKAYEDAYMHYSEAGIKAKLQELYTEAGARTEAEMKALAAAVTPEAVVAQVPTTGALNAAQAAAKAAVKALPSKITAADEAAVIAAFEAIEAYDELLVAAGKAESGMTVATQAGALKTAITNDVKLAYAKASKTDKAAMQALAATMDASNEALADVFDAYSIADIAVPAVETALANIRTAEFNAVVKAINAIPFNVTMADKATVEAARALYDAYVAEYTDYDLGKAQADAGYVADDFGAKYSELFAAEVTLGLNAPEEVDAAYSVEGLKITASSKATKGAITVKWTVEGDTDAVEGYEIWKSTKKNSGFKKAFTTTKMSYKNTKELKKGTRYFYKVRAIAYTAEGEKVKSDWSNKAYRVAK